MRALLQAQENLPLPPRDEPFSKKRENALMKYKLASDAEMLAASNKQQTDV